MLKIRVIPVLTFNGLALVKTKQFKNPRMLGNPIQTARVFNTRMVDELIFLDINASKDYRKLNLSVIKKVIQECFMPVGIGGGINSIDDINSLLLCGADKVILKSKAIDSPEFVAQAADVFGSQAICISVDVIKVNDEFFIYHQGKTSIKVSDFIQSMMLNKAGELLVTSVDNDGMMNGFDISLYKMVENKTNLPIVAIGGGGKPEHYEELFEETQIEAVGSSSIFAYSQYTPNDIKRKLLEAKKNVRYINN